MSYKNAYERVSNGCSNTASTCCDGTLHAYQQNDTEYWAFNVSKSNGTSLLAAPVTLEVISPGHETLIEIESLFSGGISSGQGVSITNTPNASISDLDLSASELVIPDADNFPNSEGKFFNWLPAVGDVSYSVLRSKF